MPSGQGMPQGAGDRRATAAGGGGAEEGVAAGSSRVRPRASESSARREGGGPAYPLASPARIGTGRAVWIGRQRREGADRAGPGGTGGRTGPIGPGRAGRAESMRVLLGLRGRGAADGSSLIVFDARPPLMRG